MRQVDKQPGQFDSSDSQIDQYATDASDRIGTDVSDETEKQLRGTMSQGQAEGETDDRIAWGQSGVVEAKQSYTIEDERTCPFCLHGHGELWRAPSETR